MYYDCDTTQTGKEIIVGDLALAAATDFHPCIMPRLGRTPVLAIDHAARRRDLRRARILNDPHRITSFFLSC